jgi:hypothetical protein
LRIKLLEDPELTIKSYSIRSRELSEENKQKFKDNLICKKESTFSYWIMIESKSSTLEGPYWRSRETSEAMLCLITKFCKDNNKEPQKRVVE